MVIPKPEEFAHFGIVTPALTIVPVGRSGWL